jgi:hypothetical protein
MSAHLTLRKYLLPSCAFFALLACDGIESGAGAHGTERSASLDGMVLPGCGGSPSDDVFIGQVDLDSEEASFEGVEVTVVFLSEAGEALDSVIFGVSEDGTFEVNSIPPEATALSAYISVDGEPAGDETFPVQEAGE